MRFGLCLPNGLAYTDPRALAVHGARAEDAGWDGFFLWDHIGLQDDAGDGSPLLDPWVTLGAIATTTTRICVGTLVTPLARRRPPKVAREAATLDLLTSGRVILGVGLGAPASSEFEQLGEETDERVRADKLDEALSVITKLWSGEPVWHSGAYYRIDGARFLPTPVQRPRIPIWVGGTWPGRGPARRAARWDGMVPGSAQWPAKAVTVREMSELRRYLEGYGADMATFDLVLATNRNGDDPPRTTTNLRAYERAGVTWWLHQAVHAESLEMALRTGPRASDTKPDMGVEQFAERKGGRSDVGT